MNHRVLRRRFVAGLFKGLRVVWPILSGLLVLIVALGVAAGLVEGWSVQESVYFSFVSGLTIGYGDFAPKTLLGRARGRVHAHASVSRCCAASHSPRNAAQTFVPADRLRRPLNSNVERLLSGSLHGRFGVVSSQA